MAQLKSKSKVKPGGLLAGAQKFSQKQVAMLVGALALICIIAVVASHASSNNPATLLVREYGLPKGTYFNVTSSNHGIGYCGMSIEILQGDGQTFNQYYPNGSGWQPSTNSQVYCQSGRNSSGIYYPIGTTRNDTWLYWPTSINTSMGTYVVSTYCFPGCRYASSGNTGGGIYIAPGDSATISLNYKHK